jgi:hypothetical protein
MQKITKRCKLYLLTEGSRTFIEAVSVDSKMFYNLLKNWKRYGRGKMREDKKRDEYNQSVLYAQMKMS